MNKDEIEEHLRHVRLLAMDIDGTLTDGGVYVLEDGQEYRRFDIKDGLGLKQVQDAGVQVVWISSGNCEAALHRASRLGIKDVYSGIKDKGSFLQQVSFNKGLPLESFAYIGDDLTDLEAMRLAGIAFATSDAASQVQQFATITTQASGGHGAVREVCDLILSARNTPPEYKEAH
jgi:3-deoxy-D-manno-octulosonate 8-phosphate phosphatase (KDO 8-P phosphatase)